MNHGLKGSNGSYVDENVTCEQNYSVDERQASDDRGPVAVS